MSTIHKRASKSIILKPWEVTALLAGATMIWRPVISLRGYGKISDLRRDEATGGFSFRNEAGRIEYLLDCMVGYCPFGVGEKIWCKEAWRQTGNKMATYRATAFFEGKWLPASTMPEWASRFHLSLVSVTCKRLTEVTVEEIEKSGIKIPVEKVGNPPVMGVLRLTGKCPPSNYFPKGYKFNGGEPDIEYRTLCWARAHFSSQWEQSFPRHPWEGFAWGMTVRRML